MADLWSPEVSGCRLVERVLSRECEQAHVVHGELRIGTVRYYPIPEGWIALPNGGVASRFLDRLEEAIAYLLRFAEVPA
jgi:hypothetical protein